MKPALVGITASLALITYLGTVGALADLLFPPQEPFTLSSPRGEPAAVSLLEFPIPYAATITQSGDGIDEPRTRFYVARSVREAK